MCVTESLKGGRGVGVGGCEGALHSLVTGSEGTSGYPPILGKDPLKVMVRVQVTGKSPGWDLQDDA